MCWRRHGHGLHESKVLHIEIKYANVGPGFNSPCPAEFVDQVESYGASNKGFVVRINFQLSEHAVRFESVWDAFKASVATVDARNEERALRRR